MAETGAQSGKAALYEDLKRRILTMALDPGAPLDETSLSARYGLSRTPLREVFRRLEGEGYLTLRDNRGAVVAPLDHRALRDFFQTAPMIYAAVARLAARNATDAQIAALSDAQGRFREAVARGASADMNFWNDRFHRAMGAAADNRYLAPSYERLLIDHARIGQTFWRARDAGQSARIATAADQHDRFIALIEAGDEEGAVALTLDHWALSRDQMDRFVRPDPLPVEPPD
jgi:DNA-binding GntR family transcriptional regulator